MALEAKPYYLPERASVLASPSSVSQCLKISTQHTAFCIKGESVPFQGGAQAMWLIGNTYDQRRPAERPPPEAGGWRKRTYHPLQRGQSKANGEREDVTIVAPGSQRQGP